MANPFYTYTYGASSFGTGIIAEDVLQFIVNITPAETPLLATIPTVQVDNIMHDWIQDTLAATSTAAANEGFAFATGSVDIPVRGTYLTRNYTQILEKGIKISNSMQRANPHAIDNWYKYQIFKAMREKTRDLERIICSRYTGQSAVGSTAPVARKMKRFVDFMRSAGNRWHIRSTALGMEGGAVTGCCTVFKDGTLNGILAKIYSKGGYADCCHINEAGKRQISYTTVNSSYRRNVDAAERTQTYPVDIVETEFGRLELYMNRNVPQAVTETDQFQGGAMFFERGIIRLGVYRPFEHVALAPQGDYMLGYIVGEYTLEVGHSDACMWVRGISGKSVV